MQQVIAKPVKATPRRTRKKEALTAEEFKQELENFASEEILLQKISAEVYSLEKGQKFQVPPTAEFPRFTHNIEFGRQELKSLWAQHTAKLKDYAQYYSAALTHRKKTGRPIRQHKIIVSPELLEFFRHADLGNAYQEVDETYQDSGVPLLDALPLFKEYGLTYSSTVVSLFYIYAKHNGLIERNMYSADALMYKYLQPSFDILASAPPTINKKGESNKVFNPNDFHYTNFNSIVKYNRYSRPDEKNRFQGSVVMNEAQVELFNDVTLTDALKQEALVARTTQEVYKLISKDTTDLSA